MEIRLHTVTDLEEARALAPLLDRWLAEGTEDLRERDSTEGLAAPFLERTFGAPETILIVALGSAEAAQPIGVCFVAPFEDALYGERLPMVQLLFVEPDFRHRGLARHLVADAERQLAERGFVRLAARAGHNDDALISMGERWGFTRRWELMVRD